MYDRYPSIKSITSITVITRRVVSIDFYRLIDAIDNDQVTDIDRYRFIERFSNIDFYRLPTLGINKQKLFSPYHSLNHVISTYRSLVKRKWSPKQNLLTCIMKYMEDSEENANIDSGVQRVNTSSWNLQQINCSVIFIFITATIVNSMHVQQHHLYIL